MKIGSLVFELIPFETLYFSKFINSKTFLKKKLEFFSYNYIKSFCRNSIWEKFYSYSKFHYAIKIFPKWNFEKISSQICRENILVSFKKKIMKIGSIVFKLIPFERIDDFLKLY